MNRKHISLMAALPAALLLAGLATAQTTPQPMSASTAQSPPCANGQTANCRSTNTHDSTFDLLAGSKGYVTKSDAANDMWLSGHFQQCDSNSDGKVNRAEYEACHTMRQRMRPQSAPPQSSGA